MDSVLLADFAAVRNNDIVADLGTGNGVSVLELVKSFEKANGIKIPYEIKPRRDGDLAEYYANAQKAKELLGWEVQLDLEDMCRDLWRWQTSNPNGY